LPALDLGPVEWLALARLAVTLRSDEVDIVVAPGIGCSFKAKMLANIIEAGSTCVLRIGDL
jgi:hypothetical protein